MDLNGHGILDVAFYQALPFGSVPAVTCINVSPAINGVTNPQQLTNANTGEPAWCPIPESDRLLNPQLGQHRGW